MALVSAKCTQCGGNVEVDNIKDTAVCPYCNTKFVIEKAINNYSTYTTNINHYTGTVIMNNSLADDIYNRASTFLKLRNFDKAKHIFFELTEKHPEDYRGWWGIVIIITNNFTDASIDEKCYLSYYENALAVADESAKNEIESIMFNYNEKRVIQKDLDAKGQSNAQICNRYQLEDVEKALGVNIPHRIIDVGTFGIRGDYIFSRFTYILGNKITGIWEYESDEDYTKKNHVEKSFECAQYVDGNIEELLSDCKKKGECYIATCVYGSYDCPQVWTLRRYRDYVLDKLWYGRVFVKCYYTISPILVKLFGNKKCFQTFWKKKLNFIVFKLNAKGIEDTLYIDKNRS